MATTDPFSKHGPFTKELLNFELKTRHGLHGVVRESMKEVLEGASTPQPSVWKNRKPNPANPSGQWVQGKVPVDTGFLRDSLSVSLSRGTGGSFGLVESTSSSGSTWRATLKRARAGDIITAQWNAFYASIIEHGIGISGPRYFVLRNTERWQAIVAQVTKRIRERNDRRRFLRAQGR